MTKKKIILLQTLTPIIEALREYNPQNNVKIENFDYGNQPYSSTSPTILLMGDNAQENKALFDSLILVSAEIAGHKPKVDFSRSNEGKVKLGFGVDKYIDIHLIPPKIDDIFVEEMKKYKDDYFATIFINSSTEEKVVYENRFLLGRIWKLFKCEYFIVGSGDTNQGNNFIVNCDICHHFS